MSFNNPIFEVGMLVATQGVSELFSPEFIAKCHARHIKGDWGDLCDEDKQTNEHALEHGSRLMSVYEHNGYKLYVITEADRSTTTYLLPEEY